MAQPPFVHLHTHSQYSLLDGVSHFGPLCERVREMGMNAVALTDHGNLFGALAFYKEAPRYEVRPIIGCELYLSPTTLADRTSAEARRVRQHLILLAKDFTGYENLCYLVSKGYLEGFYYQPRIDKELLAERREGLIALSGCMSGVVSDYLREGRRKDAERAADNFARIMGPDHFYIELMDHGLPEQKPINQQLLEIARRTGLPVVATNDSHYIHPGDAKTQDLLLAIGTGKTLEEQKRFRFAVEEFYLKSPQEMSRLFGHVPGALENTVAIAERCQSEIKLGQNLLPEFRPPEGKSAEAYLRELVRKGIEWRYGEATPALTERANSEIDVIAKTGFISYFLVVWDFVRYAREKGIAVGPGRGSGVGSVVAYTLGITDLDPIEHGLIFDRFLNLDRVSAPDFDVDFCPLRREEVIHYVRERYGKENVANIITFNTMKAKAAVRDVGRVMGMPLNVVDRVAKMIPEGPKVTIQSSLEDSPDLRDLHDSDPQIKELLDRAMRIEGSVRQPGMHAAGVVVSRRPLIETLPLYVQSGKGEVITQYNMVEVEEVGLLKIDLLGLKNLTIIEDCVRLVRENHGVEIDWAQIGLEDRKTYELLQRGDGFGVFQVESSGMREMLKRAVPSCFEDIVALIALYRPGPMQFMDSFIHRKHGREPIEYLHPAMEAILRETYGLMIYQEQVMRVASTLAGFSLGQADVLRRAMGKKKPGEMRKMREAFEKGCANNGIDAGLADEIFDTISRFAEYGFNKSHSAAYAVTTYRTAYLKAHYPAEFMAALLTNEIRGGTSEKLGVYIGVAREMGLRVLQPDVNLSQDFFSVVDGHIRFGLAAIKNVGHGPVSHLLEVRERGGPFTSFQEFCDRIDTRHVNSRAIECLIVAGAFDSLGANRPQLLSVMADAIEMGSARREMRETGQTSLFDIMGSDQASSDLNSVPLPDIPDWADREKFEREKELAGIFLSGHPLDRYRADIESFSNATSALLADLDNNQPVSMVGIVTQVREFLTRKGEAMASVEMEDFEGRFEALFFPRTLDETRPILLADSVIFLDGRFSKRPEDETGKILVNRASRIEDFRRSQTRAVEIGVPLVAVTEARLEQVRALLRGHRGQVPVRLRLIGEEGEEVVVETAPRFKISLSDAFLGEFENLDFSKSLRLVGAPPNSGAGPLARGGAGLARLHG